MQFNLLWFDKFVYLHCLPFLFSHITLHSLRVARHGHRNKINLQILALISVIITVNCDRYVKSFFGLDWSSQNKAGLREQAWRACRYPLNHLMKQLLILNKYDVSMRKFSLFWIVRLSISRVVIKICNTKICLDYQMMQIAECNSLSQKGSKFETCICTAFASKVQQL